MIKIALISAYSIIASPLLAFSSGKLRKVHKLLSDPLFGGELTTPLVAELDDLVFKLEASEVKPEEFVALISKAMVNAAERGDLDRYLKMNVKDDQNIDITLKRKLFYVPLKWWYLKLHFMAPGNIHGLHAHRNVISTQVILRGNMKVREFDRLTTLDQSPVKLRVFSDGIFSQFDSIQSTDNSRNVHGFEPYEGPAVRFQFYLRGHTSFFNRFPKRGRLYIDPIAGTENENCIMATLGESGKSGES